jgi:Zn-dependent protease
MCWGWRRAELDHREEQMEAQIKLGKLLGVKIGLHYSWILIALLITFSLASHFQSANSDWSSGLVWATAVVTGLLFFASIVVHELSHAMVARLRGLPVRSITLFALGGVAQIEKESADAKTEFWMGIVGPLTSALIGVLCLGLAWTAGWEWMADTPAAPLPAMLVWLGYINLVLALFNMVPGFPMDGGRVLRGVIWHFTGDAARATKIAAHTGQVVAYGLIILGIINFFRGAGFGGLWLAFIGWFLLSAARASYARAEMNESLRGLIVGDLMARDCLVIDGRSNLQTLVDDYLLRTGRRCFLIVEQGKVAGLVTPNEVKAVERARWPYTTVDQVMLPLERMRTVRPETPVAEALDLLGREDINQLPVVSDGRLEGIISRDQVLRLLMTRAELNL